MAGRKVKEPIVPTIWPEERIREELRRLDRKTGLHGAELPIEFYEGKSYLGWFYPLPTMRFRFSVTYIDDPHWTEQSALDLIRHEYAHYMNWMRSGNASSHGKEWKACCSEIGGRPVRCFRPEVEEGYRKRNISEAILVLRYGAYEVGKSIVHPSFGRGMIVAAAGEGPSRIIDVKFPAVGLKRLGVAWVDKNCSRV